MLLRYPEKPLETLIHQWGEFRKLFEQAKRLDPTPLGSKLLPSTIVLAFAEELMFCPTVEAVELRIQRDRQAARGCYVIAGDAASAVGRGNALFSAEVSANENSFHTLSRVVCLRDRSRLSRSGLNLQNPPLTGSKGRNSCVYGFTKKVLPPRSTVSSVAIPIIDRSLLPCPHWHLGVFLSAWLWVFDINY